MHVTPGPEKTIFSLANHELFVITAAYRDKTNGQIATWVMPTTLVPSAIRLVASISPMNFTHDLIVQSGRFALSMLSDTQIDMVTLFGLKSGRDIDKLRQIETARTPAGIPVPTGTCGWIECFILDSINTGDRMVYLAEGTASEFHPDRKPLRKNEAFAALPDDVRQELVEKQARDGKRDAAYIRSYKEI